MTNVAQSYERMPIAQQEYDKYVFDHPVSDPEKWKVAEGGTHPSRTLMRTVSLHYNGRKYFRVFAVVFKEDSLEVEQVTFGDMLP